MELSLPTPSNISLVITKTCYMGGLSQKCVLGASVRLIYSVYELSAQAVSPRVAAVIFSQNVTLRMTFLSL